MNPRWLVVSFVLALFAVCFFCHEEQATERIKIERCSESSDGVCRSMIAEEVEYGGKKYYKVRSLYAKDGDRWLPVYAVTEFTTNYPPCREIDRTGIWYTPVGGVDVEKLRKSYVPPKPLWEGQ